MDNKIDMSVSLTAALNQCAVDSFGDSIIITLKKNKLEVRDNMFSPSVDIVDSLRKCPSHAMLASFIYNAIMDKYG